MQKEEALKQRELSEEEEKKINTNRVWGYQELALQYFPHVKPESASIQFGRWIRLSDTLTASLRECGWRPRHKVLTPRQVSLIVGHLGDP